MEVFDRGTRDEEMTALTVAARLGQCKAFISHSSGDDKNEKYAALRRWCIGAGEGATIWLDSVCMPNDDLTRSLACLPIFLSGCEQLVLLVGPTYASRLWCAIELFVFLHMRGEPERISAHLLGTDPGAQVAAKVR